MAPLCPLPTAALLFLSSSNAHFILVHPQSIEGDSINEDREGNAPCGAVLPDLTKDTTNDFHVEGDLISVRLGHPQANYLFRATLEDKASGNWTQIFPIIMQSGLGTLCEPAVAVPKEWAGKKGVIGVAANAPDGILYQVRAISDDFVPLAGFAAR